MASSIQSREYQIPGEIIWQAVIQACRDLRWSIRKNNEAEGILDVKSGASILCPLGISFEIRVIKKNPVLSELRMEGKSQGQVVDYGQTNRELKKFFERLDLLISTAGQNSAPAAAGKACAKCGSALKNDVRFCTKCGEPVA